MMVKLERTGAFFIYSVGIGETLYLLLWQKLENGQELLWEIGIYLNYELKNQLGYFTAVSSQPVYTVPIATSASEDFAIISNILCN